MQKVNGRNRLDIVGTVYHLVIYMQSNKIHSVVLMSKFYSALTLPRHVSDLIGPSSGAFCTSCIRKLWYVVLRVLLDTSSRYKVVVRRNKVAFSFDVHVPNKCPLSVLLLCLHGFHRLLDTSFRQCWQLILITVP